MRWNVKREVKFFSSTIKTFSNNLPVFLSSVKILNGELNRFSSFDYDFKTSPDQQLWFMKLNFTIITIIINNEADNQFISTSWPTEF